VKLILQSYRDNIDWVWFENMALGTEREKEGKPLPTD
jgi:hypothetical protein